MVFAEFTAVYYDIFRSIQINIADTASERGSVMTIVNHMSAN